MVPQRNAAAVERLQRRAVHGLRVHQHVEMSGRGFPARPLTQIHSARATATLRPRPHLAPAASSFH